jgi:hypothetical protein
MQKLIILMSLFIASLGSSWADQPAKQPPVNNVVPPCDDALNSKKPSCNIDSDSVNVPPKMPNEKGVIVPPEVPAEGLPNRENTKPEPLDVKPNAQDKNLKN